MALRTMAAKLKDKIPAAVQRVFASSRGLVRSPSLSTTSLFTVGLDTGPTLLGHGLLWKLRRSAINPREEATRRLAWIRTERRLRPRRLARRVLRVLCSLVLFFLLDPHLFL
jgi:hypothetical protein